MTVLEAIESLPQAQALSWALLHFLWQGVVVAVLVAALLRILRGAAPQTRYLVCCAGLTLMLAAPLVSFAVCLRTAPQPASVAPAAELLAAPSLTEAAAAALGNDRTSASGLSDRLPALAAVWLAGVVLFQLRLLLNVSRAAYLKHRGLRPAPPRWQRATAELCARMGVRRSVRIFESALAPVPMVVGWVRPAILVPASALSGLTPEQLRAILAHEIAHVRRYDDIVNLLQAVLESLLFYHPAVWWLSRRLRDEREFCCDDAAVRVCGDALCYAQALAALDEARAAHAGPCAAAVASTGGILMNRIRRILDLRPQPRRRAAALLAPTAIMAATALAAASLSFAVPAEIAETAVKPPKAGEHARHAEKEHAEHARNAEQEHAEHSRHAERAELEELEALLREIREGDGARDDDMRRDAAAEQRAFLEALLANRSAKERARADADVAALEQRLAEHLMAADENRLYADDAKVILEEALRQAKMAAEGKRQQLTDRAKTHLHQLHAEMAEQVAAGEVSEKAAQKHLEQARKMIESKVRDELQAMKELLEMRVLDVRAKLEREVVAGAAADKVKEHLAQLHEELEARREHGAHDEHTELRAIEEHRAQAEQDGVEQGFPFLRGVPLIGAPEAHLDREHLEVLMQHLHAAIDEGKISEAQAREHLHEALRALGGATHDAAERLHEDGEHLHAMKEHLHDAIKAGKITEDQAMAHLDEALSGLGAATHEGILESLHGEGEHLDAVKEYLHQAIEAGKIGADEARARLHEMMQAREMAEARHADAEAEAAAHAEHRMQRLHEAIESGEISPDEATARLHEALRAREMAQQAEAAAIDADRMQRLHQRFEALRARIHAAVEAGRLSEEDVHTHLERVLEDAERRLREAEEKRDTMR